MASFDDLDIPVDVVLEGEFAPPAPIAAAASAPAAAAAPAAAPQAETRVEALQRLLGQVRARRRPAA